MTESTTSIKLNTLKPASGSKRPRRRVGRGLSGHGAVTGGRGCKGQKSRAGGKPRVGFEGGQMPLQRRLPKLGFRSRRAALADEVRLNELARVQADVVDKQTLVDAKLVKRQIKKIKVIKSGELTKAVTVKGLAVTAGARQAIEAVGGKVEE